MSGKVSIRCIAVLGFQPEQSSVAHRCCTRRFHPLYRGTWFPTSMIFSVA